MTPSQQILLRGYSIPIADPGQQAFTTSGTHTWTCPSGVSAISIVAIGGGGKGGGGGGGGAGLGYKNNYAVTAGQDYTVVVGGPGSNNTHGGDTYFVNTSTVMGEGGDSAASGASGSENNGGASLA